MNTMIKRISEVIRKAIDEAPFQSKYIIGDDLYKVINTATNIVAFTSGDMELAEAEMDRLNDEWIARKVVECMKGEMPQDVYKNFACTYQWSEMTSTKIWNNWLDAILKE